MSYVIRAEDGKYLQVWHACDDGHVTRVERVEKKDASSYKSRSEAREAIANLPGSRELHEYTIEVR